MVSKKHASKKKMTKEPVMSSEETRHIETCSTSSVSENDDDNNNDDDDEYDDDDDDDDTRMIRNDENQELTTKHEKTNNKEPTSNLPIWLSSIAIFGDSSWALVASFLLWLLAVGIALNVDKDGNNKTFSVIHNNNNSNNKEYEVAYQRLGPIPEIGPAIIYEMAAAPWIDEHHGTATTSNTTTTTTTSDDDDIFHTSSKDKRQTQITNEMKMAFERDGVIAIRGLIPNDLLERLDEASLALMDSQKKNKPKEKILTGRKKSPSQFHTVQQGAIFLNLTNHINNTDSNNNNDENQNTTTTNRTATISSTHEEAVTNTSPPPPPPPFYQVAIQSVIPEIAAQLLSFVDDDGNDGNPRHPHNQQNLRVLRDIFLSKDEEEYICGWHVDDTGFWPATHEAPGVNAWIALDDMPVELGGGFALAVGSHTASWRYDAYQVTGSTHTFPPQGFESASDMLNNRAGNGTCNIATAAPHLHRRMEETKRIYDVRKGDVIFHTRWLFHRTVPFERSVVEERQKQRRRRQQQKQKQLQQQQQQQTDEEDAAELAPLVYRRFSVRYGPGSSRIPLGFGMEPSVLWDEKNGGRTADEVAELDAPWYPQAWPKPSDKEYEQMQMLSAERWPKVTEQSNNIRKQLQKLRSRNQDKHYSRQPH